ncbi:MAG: NfeD family protein [Desulforhopalus sp.]
MGDPALYWLITGVMLFFLGLAMPGVVLLFFAVGALLTALFSWLTPLDVVWQLAIFILVSLGSLFGLRSIIEMNFFDKTVDDKLGNDSVSVVPGDQGIVSTAIHPPGEGRIKYSGTYWRATADEKIDEGEIIAVVRQKDLVIHVKKIS